MKKTIDKNVENSSEKPQVSRRAFFERVMLSAVGGSALLMLGSQQAAAKVAKRSAQYRSSPSNGKKCAGCSHYRGNGKCNLVAGNVSSNGYCRYYARKKSGYGY